jgi:hypothetical protein
MEKEATKGAAKRRTGILKAEAFLDTGALGGNFISQTYADFLTTKGFKIEKLDSLCSIATPDGINNLKAPFNN